MPVIYRLELVELTDKQAVFMAPMFDPTGDEITIKPLSINVAVEQWIAAGRPVHHDFIPGDEFQPKLPEEVLDAKEEAAPVDVLDDSPNPNL